MKRIFATTRNVAMFYQGIETVEAPVNGRVGMALLFGPPGTGKTEICQKYAADNNAPYIRATDIMTRRGLLSKIVAQLGEAPAYSSDALFDQAVDQLLGHPQTIIVDEVDYLCRGGVVEILRDLNDITGVPIVLVGMQEVDRKLKRYRHLWDRLTAIVHFVPLATQDVESLAKQICDVRISDRACKYICDRNGGKLRGILLWFARVEQLARSSSLDYVELEHLQALDKVRK